MIIGRFGEIHLKGSNRGLFLRALRENLRNKLKADPKTAEAKVLLEDARILVRDYPAAAENAVKDAVKSTFGIVSLSVATEIKPATRENIEKYVAALKISGSFRATVNRADKNFSPNSNEFAKILGGIVLDNNKGATVNLTAPETTLFVEIRAESAFVYFEEERAVGGLPVGTAGRAICLLSGGIDSPVAGYLAAKRGLSVDFIHFASPPYTSPEALEKVKNLRDIVSRYCGRARLFVVPFTKIQQEIHSKCADEFMITLMRRFMIKIAEKVGLEIKADCIITGENLAQVASQTIQGIASNNFCAEKLPILRPLITFDKQEIIAIAKRIGSFEESIKPFIDCCTVFVPTHPAIKPKLNKVIAEEAKLDFDALIAEAISGMQTY